MPLIKFGTDGWRAIMGKEFTFKNVELVAQAFSDYLQAEFKAKKKSAAPKVAVGFDYRKDSERFAKTFSEVLNGNGVTVLLASEACPTPAVSFTIIDRKYDAGIVVTASHNPPEYNGIKIKTDSGGSADKDVTDRVELFVGKNPVKKAPFTAANPSLEDLNQKYFTNLEKYVRLDKIKEGPYRILVDSMHGVGAKRVETILAGGRIAVTTIRSERDVHFGGVHPEPIPRYIGPAIEAMKKGDYDLAVVTDGDADRIGAVRPGGEFVSPGTLMSLILLHFVEDLGRKGSVVTTISNTALVYKVAKKLGLKVHETSVGFKYVCEIMKRENVLIGGEESGGIGFQDYLFERDGILSALLLFQMMAVRRQTFEEILRKVESEFGKLHYERQDITFPLEAKAKLSAYLVEKPPQALGGKKIKNINSRDGVKYVLEDDSWLLFRFSGTEPILRIYAEGTSPALAKALAAEGKKMALAQAGTKPVS